MSNNIESKVVVITGASSGLGAAAARLLSQQGAAVVLGARRADRIPAIACATKYAVRAISEGLRQEVKPYNFRTTIISPGAVHTELADSITEKDVSDSIHKFYAEHAIPADSFARVVAFAVSQPEDVDINGVLFRPTRQAL